jgi:hypothetical protein
MNAEYESDEAGNAVIVGLTADETSELILLDAMEPLIAATIPQGDNDPSAPIREKRKRELIEKHSTALIQRFLPLNSTMH